MEDFDPLQLILVAFNCSSRCILIHVIHILHLLGVIVIFKFLAVIVIV